MGVGILIQVLMEAVFVDLCLRGQLSGAGWHAEMRGHG